ncbi:MAG: NAD(P)H-dependent oxidoreductase [Hyphomicrobiales bacterium]|nr:NAD(P)H-dependent oxidoreductase [Hyphomicrobiales bacterium]MCP5370308.1 NAD(P)H-dependent oxidoreductase [Hyphomicrobiales bacterium]
MNHLVVFAHPRANSFNQRVRDSYLAGLYAGGHQVVLRDLYRMGFDPVFTDADAQALRRGAPPPDIRAEMDHVTAADVITFISPIWWISLPAILKGYVDRVFAYGFAYRHGADGLVEGMLEGKKAVIFTSSGSTLEHFEKSGKLQAVRTAQDLGTMEFCGIELLRHVHFAPVGSRSDPETVDRWVEQARELAETLFG